MALHELNNPRSLPPPAPVIHLTRDIEPSRLLKLATALQTTLEPEKLLRLFSAVIQDILPHHSLDYRHTGRKLGIQLGHTSIHQCRYRLNIPEADLGEICLGRDVHFSARDMDMFEQVLHVLAYPLRNALFYQDALDSARRDPLTGIGNRAAMEDQFQREVALARRHGQPLSLLLADIDRFKLINDAYGHDAGDAVLRAVAQGIQKNLRQDDLLFRYGGEEFLILLRSSPLEGAMVAAEHLRKSIEQMVFVHDGKNIRVTISIGVAKLQDESAAALFQRADQALYQAKQHGRNLVQLAQ